MDHSQNAADVDTNGIPENGVAPIAPYCQATTPTLIRVNRDKVVVSKIQEELEIKLLIRKHQDADGRIAALLKRIQEASAASKTLESRRSTFSQQQPQTRMRVTRTGELMKLVKDEVETLRADASEAAEKVDVVARGLAEVRALTSTADGNMKRVAELEARVEKEMEKFKAEPAEGALVGGTDHLEQAVKAKLEVVEEKRRRYARVAELKGEKIAKLEAICVEVEQVEDARRRSEEKRRESDERRREAQREIEKLERKVEELSAQKTALEDAEVRSRASNDELDAKIKEAREEIRNLEAELAAVAAAADAEGRLLEERKEALRVELDGERRAFGAATEDLEKIREEIARLEEVRAERCAASSLLKTDLDETRSAVTEAKSRVAELRQRLEQLSAKVPAADRLLDDLKATVAELEESAAELARRVDSLPAESAKRADDARKQLEDVNEKLSKRLELLRASSELLQDRLTTVSAEWELVRVQNELLEQQVLTEKVQLERKFGSLAVLQKEAADLREAHRRLAKVGETVPEDSGRRSPGILKIANKSPKKPPATSPKKVTFEGLSSTQSTSGTVESEDEKRGWTLDAENPPPKKPRRKIFDF